MALTDTTGYRELTDEEKGLAVAKWRSIYQGSNDLVAWGFKQWAVDCVKERMYLKHQLQMRLDDFCCHCYTYGHQDMSANGVIQCRNQPDPQRCQGKEPWLIYKPSLLARHVVIVDRQDRNGSYRHPEWLRAP